MAMKIEGNGAALRQHRCHAAAAYVTVGKKAQPVKALNTTKDRIYKHRICIHGCNSHFAVY